MPEILAIGGWTNNADMIADAVAPMGYLDGSVIDLTYNAGKFWKRWRPYELTTNDLDEHMPADYHEDCRNTSWQDQQFDACVIDLPYKLGGTPRSERMDIDYGTTFYRSRDVVTEMHIDACTEGARISSQYVHVKTMNQVSGGKVRWLADEVNTHMRHVLGFEKVTAFMLLGGRPQPQRNRDGSCRRQEHPRNNYSTWLVFRR